MKLVNSILTNAMQHQLGYNHIKLETLHPYFYCFYTQAKDHLDKNDIVNVPKLAQFRCYFLRHALPVFQMKAGEISISKQPKYERAYQSITSQE